jgi:hypothetical protein
MGCGTNKYHYYHYKCLFSWLIEKTMCPLCRESDILKTHNLRSEKTDLINQKVQLPPKSQQFENANNSVLDQSPCHELAHWHPKMMHSVDEIEIPHHEGLLLDKSPAEGRFLTERGGNNSFCSSQ